ncbi:hypothetical protein F441_02683 [Phytophthora nicotianae CJ01A1]|uniref:Uncharacterized protein n=2 Tax=Phytophthora nicotianae TaxID=4792 RepID=W2HIC3_PHYNI|nr:hypothetical protein L915_02598 [Phytophthora nicotianae]ETL47696.1 hypothetical protein L916_02574 [Phytophthora nicotianae]ETP24297.1 hypothetical protein F441_02683 [Phytophthora nicotianae CJ01A1]
MAVGGGLQHGTNIHNGDAFASCIYRWRFEAEFYFGNVEASVLSYDVYNIETGGGPLIDGGGKTRTAKRRRRMCLQQVAVDNASRIRGVSIRPLVPELGPCRRQQVAADRCS